VDDDEWLCAYLLRFGTKTIESADTQPGETEFLSDMAKQLNLEGQNVLSVWWVITRAWRRRQGRPID